MEKYWIMKKNFLNIHPLTIFFLFLACMTGYFQYVVYFMSLIFIHELGHVSAGVICGWNMKKIILLPFGGMTVFEEKMNRPIKEEFLIVMMGPIYQILFYYFLVFLGFETPLLTNIHYFLLGFNLLPIYPLDGSKLCQLFLELFFSVYYSQLFICFFSFITILIYFFFHDAFLDYVLVIFLLYQLYLLFQKREEYFLKFLLERYLYVFSFSKIKRIKRMKEMKRDYFHFFHVSDQMISEKEVLKSYFKSRNKT